MQKASKIFKMAAWSLFTIAIKPSPCSFINPEALATIYEDAFDTMTYYKVQSLVPSFGKAHMSGLWAFW